jgi:hypothetical protein
MAGKPQIKKKGGRPATGKDPMIGVRVPPEMRREIEAWAARQPDSLSFSEAVRRLINRGLLSPDD